ncbi:hypothetical protein ABT263_33990 [Kitasatospora sp. NPDC001603]|uniref:hypothetical protein n=1 Tax=Kitasatospora sp. NPDC001603 TaxID=3154388 RepID=UPI003319FBD8
MTAEQDRADGSTERTAGALRRTDEALTRRGFTTRRLRLRAAAVIVAITAAASGVLLYELTNALGPDTVCGGAATADEVHTALGPGRISEEKSDGWSPGAYDRTAACRVTVSYGLFGPTGRSAALALALPQDEVTPPTAPEARLFAGGSTGAVLDSRAWALLPDGCPKAMRAEVRLLGSDDTVGGRAAGMAALAVAFANTAAESKGCGGGLPAPSGLSAAATPQPADLGNVCGLPGMAPARDPQAGEGYRQTVTAGFAPVWSCAISSPSGLNTQASFTITTDPRVSALDPQDARTEAYGRARWIGSSGENVVATCQGKSTYFHLDRKYSPGVAGSGLFPDTADLWRQFLVAGGKAVGCEPIIP